MFKKNLKISQIVEFNGNNSFLFIYLYILCDVDDYFPVTARLMFNYYSTPLDQHHPTSNLLR